MKGFHPEYVVDGNQKKKAVLLPIAEWEEIILAMEDLGDIQAYDNAKKISDEVIPFNQVVFQPYQTQR